MQSLNVFFKEMHEDRSGEFVRGYWSLKDKMIADKLCKSGKKGAGTSLIANKQRIKANRDSKDLFTCSSCTFFKYSYIPTNFEDVLCQSC